MLLLSWLGWGIVALDLLNCTKAQSAYSPLHPLACDDIGTLAASQQTNDRDGQRRAVTHGYPGAFPDAVCWWCGVVGSWEFTWEAKMGESNYVWFYFIINSCVLTNILLIWIGILFICQFSCRILLPWCARPLALSVPSFPLTAMAASPAMDLARQSLFRRSAPYLIYPISKAIAPQSPANHPSHIHMIPRPWTIWLSKTKSMSIVAIHMWSLPAMVTQWDGAVRWRIWMKLSRRLSIMQEVQVHLEVLPSRFPAALFGQKHLCDSSA